MFTSAMQIIGMIAAVAIGGRLSVSLPFSPVPVTMQTFAVQLGALLLGSVKGAAAMCILLLYTVSLEELIQVKLASPKGSKKSLGYVVGFVFGAALLWGLLRSKLVLFHIVSFLHCFDHP